MTEFPVDGGASCDIAYSESPAASRSDRLAGHWLQIQRHSEALSWP